MPERGAIYAAIMEGSAVCGGIADAYAFLLNRAGIPACTVTGQAVQEGETIAHAWNFAMLDGAVYEMAETSEAPDGEYYILEFPETEERLDFFLMDAEKSYVRHVWMDEENAELYTITFEDKDRKASEIMAEWYQALAEANGKIKAN